MSLFSTISIFVIGLVCLTLGAEMLVRGASNLARVLKISSLVIGLTVVAFGTSCPELSVSVQSALVGQADIALGNVVGSNIFNVLFILGVLSLILPLGVSLQVVRFDVPIMIVTSICVFGMGLDGKIGRIDGFILFFGVLLYTFWLFHESAKTNKIKEMNEQNSYPASSNHVDKRDIIINCLLVISGLALLVFGARFLVKAAVEIAHILGTSELVIGLTIVAVGTSLPEAATSVVASIRRERDIAVGNIVGSNIFNILAVLGLSGAISPNGVTVSTIALHFDIPIMIVVAIACLPIFFTGHVIARWEGLLFIAYYIAYTVYLILSSSHHNALPEYKIFLIWFAFPLTTIIIIASLVCHWKSPVAPSS